MANTVLPSTSTSGMVAEPLWLQATGGDAAISYSAQDFRAALDALLAGEGVFGAGDLKVSQRAAGANFSVDIAIGRAAVLGDDVARQGKYTVQTTAIVNCVTPAAPGSGTRTHRVIARIRDKQAIGSGTYDWSLELLEDTGSGLPALPASAISLAKVSIAAGQASVLDANITDLRPYATIAGAGRTLARRTRTTASSTTTTEVGVLRIDNIPVRAGSVIAIMTSGLLLNSSVAGDLIYALVRVNNAGVATTGSTQVGGIGDTAFSAAGAQRAAPVSAFYFPAVDEVISVLLSVARDASGSGLASLAVPSAAWNMTMTVRDSNVIPNTGVDI